MSALSQSKTSGSIRYTGISALYWDGSHSEYLLRGNRATGSPNTYDEPTSRAHACPPCRRALSLLIGAVTTANCPLRGFVVPWTLANTHRFGASVLLAAPSAAQVLSAFVGRAVPRPPCLPAAVPVHPVFRRAVTRKRRMQTLCPA